MENTKNFIDKQFYALGTINYIKVFDFSDPAALNLAVARVNEIERHMSAFLPDSDITRINVQAGKGFVPIHKDTMLLLKHGALFSELSGGAFQLTIRPLVTLWGIGKKKNYIPYDMDIKTVQKFVNDKDLLLDEKNCQAFLQKAGQSIDLGGIAKGYAADEVKRILKEHHVVNAIINLGGNVLTMGTRPDGGWWQIGIQNPMAATGKHIGILSLPEKTVVTSGSNERFFIKDGIRYHHILDARTGKPAQSSLLGVTVVGDCSLEADALTTALFVLGMEAGIHLLKEFKAEALFITDQLSIYLTDGLRGCFTL